jgi:acyl-CoA synthetase (NDP forming)
MTPLSTDLPASRTSGRVLLDAQSVAIVGASPDDGKIGGKPVRFLRDFGFKGRVYPVNPKYQEIRGWRCYPDVASIDEPIDIVVVTVPHQAALPVVRQCVSKGVRQIVMFSSGYAETGEEGRARQQELLEVLRGSATRLIGPNTLGIANLASGMVANFGQAFELPAGVLKSGRAGFVSQSGAFGTFIFTLAAENGVGFKYFVITGNESDVSMSEVIDAMLDDPEIDLVACYIEGLRDGRALLCACERARSLGKLIVLIKTGRTPGGSAAAQSHTAAIAGADEVYEAVFRQTGVLRVVDEEEMLDILTLCRGAHPVGGSRIGVLTMSGGAGVMLADSIDTLGLELAHLRHETTQALSAIVPAFGSTRNPVDLTGQFLAEPQMLDGALRGLLADPGVDAVIFFLGLGRRHGERIARTLRAVAKDLSKPLVVAWTAGPPGIIAGLLDDGIPVLPSPTRAVRAMAASSRHRHARSQPARSFSLPCVVGAPLVPDGQAGRCSEAKTKQLLAEFGVTLPGERLVATADEAVAHAMSLEGPVVLKVCAADLPHKTEAGAVALGIRGEREVRAAHARILAACRQHAPQLRVQGVIVAPMMRDGVELIVGARRDPVFGPVVAVGAGGIHAEVLRDMAIAALPLVPGEAMALVRSLRIWPLLDGARGQPRADVDALIGVVEAVSAIMLGHPEIQEIEINPVRVLPRGMGAWPLDATMILGTSARARCDDESSRPAQVRAPLPATLRVGSTGR